MLDIKWTRKKTRLLTLVHVCLLVPYLLFQGITYVSDAVYSYEFVANYLEEDIRTAEMIDAELEQQRLDEIRLAQKEVQLTKLKRENTERRAQLERERLAKEEVLARIEHVRFQKRQLQAEPYREIRPVKKQRNVEFKLPSRFRCMYIVGCL